MLNIEPIKLLAGSHPDTGTTGNGCFMNVIAYLNGEPQITDKSPCVCVTIREIAVWINDYLSDSERVMLIPFIHRAMGTATEDRLVMKARLKEVVSLANDMASYAYTADAARAAYTAAAYAYAAAYTAAAYAYAAANAAARAAANAARAANADAYADAADRRTRIINRVFAFLDAVCPPADEPTREVIERADRLMELFNNVG